MTKYRKRENTNTERERWEGEREKIGDNLFSNSHRGLNRERKEKRKREVGDDKYKKTKFIKKRQRKRDNRGHFYQHVYTQLLCMQIPKAQIDSQVISVFLHFWDLCE
jgi:hypothetical protein